MISTHVLDTHLGHPATGIAVRLEKMDGVEWKDLGTKKTNEDGRISYNCPHEEGIYKLIFTVEDYYKKNKQEFFFSKIPIIFKITDTERKYHVPILLSPYGYTTYRGS